ncbi:MAG: hypothetical protein HY813_03520 [Candidatus Portnoybacteria bacterium]|nr:hypothetical protein [Candidatus Portnoybacteria bacterium]
MQFYHDIVTEKSFRFLQDLRRKYKFVLIGGWAVFLYSHSLKSKDVDIIVDYEELASLKESYDVFKNDRLKKYEIKTGEFDIDIYVPLYSQIGIEPEEIKKEAVNKEGFFVPRLETLFVLKLYAWRERQGSLKGGKDELDIFSLAALPEFDWPRYSELIKKYKFESLNGDFLKFIKRTTRVSELEINEQRMAKLKKKIFDSMKV